MEVCIQKKLSTFKLDLNFRFSNKIMGILGASGCGKSITLKSIAGIEKPDYGKILLHSEVLYDSVQQINLVPQKRKVGYLFQNYALFPNMTVEQNIGCSLMHLDRLERAKICTELINSFELSGLEKQYPKQISGGQQQRTALARIFASKPEAILLDEPFSALDSHLKEQMQIELKQRLKTYKKDTIIVTHSRDEAYRLCDELLIMDQGKIILQGETKKVFENPQIVTAAKLTGCKNFSRAKPINDHKVFAIDWNLLLTTDKPVSEEIDFVGIRAHDFIPIQSSSEENCFPVLKKEEFETPFEKNSLFNIQGTDQFIWWKVSKALFKGEVPQYLTVKPQNILLLQEKERTN